MDKKFKLTAEEIKRLVPDMGGAFATDYITVDGKKVDYMVRNEPEREDDSGWIFYGGGETQEYIDDAKNISIFSVNTIANYDSDIIPFLTYPPGTEIERNAEGKLELITKDINPPSIKFMWPVDQGRIHVTKNWSFEITSHMLRRLDDHSLVIWKPEFTIWLNAYGANGISISDRFNKYISIQSADAFDQQQEEKDGLTKLRYYLVEEEDGRKQASAYISGFTNDHEIHMSIYYDSDEYLPEIDKIWETIEAKG